MAKNSLKSALIRALIFHELRSRYPPGNKVMILATSTTVKKLPITPATPSCACKEMRIVVVAITPLFLSMPVHVSLHSRRATYVYTGVNRAVAECVTILSLYLELPRLYHTMDAKVIRFSLTQEDMKYTMPFAFPHGSRREYPAAPILSEPHAQRRD